MFDDLITVVIYMMFLVNTALIIVGLGGKLKRVLVKPQKTPSLLTEAMEHECKNLSKGIFAFHSLMDLM